MATAAFDRVAPGDNQFEAWARALCQFVIRALILPVTFVFTKPSAMLRAVETGEYRPLPSPFLLALITGIVLSGVTSSVPKLFNATTGADGVVQEAGNAAFFGAVIGFYRDMNAIETILFAVPYILVLWLFAGLISFCMWRGIRTAEALMTALSLSLSALIELVIITSVVSLLLASAFQFDLSTAISTGESVTTDSLNNVVLVMAGVVGLYTLILAFKLVRLIFAIRKERGSPIFGAIIAVLPVLFVLTIAGAIGAGATIAGPLVVQQAVARDLSEAEFQRYQSAQNARAEGLAAMERRDYPAAARAYDDMLFYDQSASAHNSACWARAVWGEASQLARALNDCDIAVQLEPENRFALDSRALVHLKMGNLAAAMADYEAAFALDETYAHALYGRGIARLWLGQANEGAADLQQALAMQPTLTQTFAQYGVVAERSASTLLGAAPVGDPRVTFAPATTSDAMPAAP